jgi:hypothetical protein
MHKYSKDIKIVSGFGSDLVLTKWSQIYFIRSESELDIRFNIKRIWKERSFDFKKINIFSNTLNLWPIGNRISEEESLKKAIQ